MSDCMTCRHNDLVAQFCPFMDVHTDLGCVPNCAAWAPTDKYEMKRLKAEVARLWELVDYMGPIAWYAASPNERKRMREMGVSYGG